MTDSVAMKNWRGAARDDDLIACFPTNWSRDNLLRRLLPFRAIPLDAISDCMGTRSNAYALRQSKLVTTTRTLSDENFKRRNPFVSAYHAKLPCSEFQVMVPRRIS